MQPPQRMSKTRGMLKRRQQRKARQPMGWKQNPKERQLKGQRRKERHPKSRQPKERRPKERQPKERQQKVRRQRKRPRKGAAEVTTAEGAAAENEAAEAEETATEVTDAEEAAATADTAETKSVEEETPRRAPVLRAVQDSVITEIEALLRDGSGPVGDIEQWQVFRLNAKFALPNDTVHAGDTTTITLPDKLIFNQTAPFEIRDKDGNVVANAVINGRAKTITLTYTDYVENNSDITGSFFVYLQLDRAKIDGEEDIPLEIDVNGRTVVGEDLHFVGIPDPVGRYLTKSGYQMGDLGNRVMRFRFNVNTVGDSMSDVTITDNLATPGFTIRRDSLRIIKGQWRPYHGDWEMDNQETVTDNYTVTWNDDGSFVIHLGDVGKTDGFIIVYDAEASYDLVDGEVVENGAVLKGSDTRPYTASVRAVYFAAGGTAEGYVYKIKINKVDESGAALEGAVFDVIRVANGAKVGTVTTNAEGEASISGLLKGEYRLVEVTAPEGYVLPDDPVVVAEKDFDSNKTADVTVINHPDKISIPVCKVWENDNNADGMRPDSVTVKLIADGEDTGRTLILSESNNWSGTFDNLEKGRSYYVEEVGLGGYSVQTTGDAENGFKIINSMETTSLKIRKVWLGPIPPGDIVSKLLRSGGTIDIYVELLANGEPIGVYVLNEDNNWNYEIENLRKYDPYSGAKIEYKINELNSPGGYETSQEGDQETGITIINKCTITRDLYGSKTWEDNDDQDGKRPASITIRLLADGTEVDSRIVTEEDEWIWGFENLPAYADDGHEIFYAVTEDAISDYTPDYNGFDVINTHTPGKTSITVTKAWDDADNQDGIRPDGVVIRLLADGEDTGKEVVLNEEYGWTAVFSELDEFKNGRKIVYTVEEEEVSGYTATITGDAESGFVVTNTHTPGKTNIAVTKVWDDADNQDGIRPDGVVIRLLADGKDTGISAELNDEKGWSAVFLDLDEFKGGSKIVYTVEEDEVSGYTATITGDAESGYIVTNTHAPEKIEISVVKVWDDQNNKNGNRPGQVTIRLLADGEDTGKTLVLSDDNNWRGSFTDLDLNRDGERIGYSITEDEVEGYTTAIEGSADTGFTVTNKEDEKPEKPKEDDKKPKNDEKKSSSGRKKGTATGDDSNAEIYLLMLLLCGGAAGLLFRKSQKSRREKNR